MKKRIGFAFLAAAIGCAMIALAQAGMGTSTEGVVRTKMDLPAPAAYASPMPFQVLKPLY
jgi:hypothetical protein